MTDFEVEWFVYRIKCRFGRWVTRSNRYFHAIDATHALLDFQHVYRAKKAPTHSVTVHKIERYDRFADRWNDETDSVDQTQFTNTTFQQNGKIKFIPGKTDDKRD